tara:strand:- start:150 stop:476 length:327 start_codon:yes stop_codon:yes gene_type:complete
MPTATISKTARVKSDKKFFDKFMKDKFNLDYLYKQIRTISYNEKYISGCSTFGKQLMDAIALREERGEVRTPKPRPTYVIPAEDEEPKQYERQKCGGKGQTILVPIEP